MKSTSSSRTVVSLSSEVRSPHRLRDHGATCLDGGPGRDSSAARLLAVVAYGVSTVADLIYTTNVSLDGFIEDDKRQLRLLGSRRRPTSPSSRASKQSAGTYLYGRRLYELMAVWETDPGLGAQSELMADFAGMWQAADKVVYSTTLEAVAHPPGPGWNANVDADAIRAIKDSAHRPSHRGRGEPCRAAVRGRADR